MASAAALLAASQRIDAAAGVNLRDGSVGHFAIKYDDDHCDAQDAIALLRQAAASNALLVIGPSCSSVAEPLYGILQHRVNDANDAGLRIPVFTDGATKADLTKISDWAFRNWNRFYCWGNQFHGSIIWRDPTFGNQRRNPARKSPFMTAHRT